MAPSRSLRATFFSFFTRSAKRFVEKAQQHRFAQPVSSLSQLPLADQLKPGIETRALYTKNKVVL
jgi:hypothetical protein